MSPFRLLSNHGLVLLCIADDPTVRMRDIAGNLGITERGAQRIVAELVEAGLVERQRIGRRNRYRVRSERAFQLPTGQRVRVGALLDVLREPAGTQLPASEHVEREAARLLDSDADWGSYLSGSGLRLRAPAVETALIGTDLTGIVRVWNRLAEQLYGWRRDEALGRPVTDLTVGPEDAEVSENIMLAVRLRGSWQGEFWVRRRDGSRFLAYVHDEVVHDREGEPIGLVGLSAELPSLAPSRYGQTAPADGEG